MKSSRAYSHLGMVGCSVVAVALAAPGGAGQGATPPANAEKAPAPAAPTSSLAWAEVLEQKPDPKVVTDADLFKRITETRLPWRVKDRATGIEMLLVPPGEFVMGMSPGDTEAVELEEVHAKANPELKSSERPAHEVAISQAFYLGRTEVTQEQWVGVMKANPSHSKGGADAETLTEKYMAVGLTKREAQGRAALEAGVNPNAMHPVERVSWDDCQEFCAKTGTRLPTEAEWEYACRAGVRMARYGELDRIAWHRDNSDSTQPSARKAPNALGFFDMLGNVYEWCQDWFQGDYYRSCEDGVVDPCGPAGGAWRVLRGGSAGGVAGLLRCSYRYGFSPDVSTDSIGFRVARNP